MELQIKFKDQSQSFTNGVEFGRLLEKMQRGDDTVKNYGFPVRIENKEVIETSCMEYGYIALFGEQHFDEWIEFLGIKKTFTNN
jgi:hypothetical protein